MTFLLSAIPLVFGYIITSRVVGERTGYLRVPLAWALGLSCFLLGVNALFHALSLRSSVWVTLGLLVAIAAAVWWSLPARRATWPRLGRLESSALIVLTLTAFFRALFWQMKYSDDDFFPHAPLMALYLRDVFPPRNPFFPDEPYLGHYGRDLTISALSILWGDRFFAVQYVVTALNHAATVPLAYFASRRFLRSWRQALLAVTLIFLGLNPYLGRSLLDVFTNNNSFAHLFLVLNAYLFLSAIRCPRGGVAVLSALCLATYSIVYTTHHGVLLVAFPLLALAMTVRSRRRRGLRLATAGVIVGASLAISLVHGGTLTHLSNRALTGLHGSAGVSRETALVSQQVQIRFPKGRLGFTAFDGTAYSLFSRRFLQEAGFAAALLPVTLLVLFVARRAWALLMGMIGVVAVMVPATVDFGAYENDSYRFLFLAGIGASAALGATLGLGLDHLARGGRLPGWARAATVGFLAVVCASSVAGSAWAFWDVVRRSDEYPWTIGEWACRGVHREACEPVDAATAVRLRPLVRPGETLLTNIAHDRDHEFIAHSVVGTLAGAFVVGHGIHVYLDPSRATGREVREQTGYRAAAFWATGASELLDDLRVDWLIVDASRLPAPVRERLQRDSRLRRIHREEDAAGGGVRDIYRVQRRSPPAEPRPANLALVSAVLPSRMGPGWFSEVAVVVAIPDPTFQGRIRMSARIRSGSRVVNAGDVITVGVELRRSGAGRWAGTFPFVSPFEPGRYSVEITAGSDDGSLKTGEGAAFVLPLEVL